MSAQRYLLRKAVLAPSFHAVPSGLLQRKCACGQHTIAGRECKECSKKREVRLQRAAVSSPLAGSVPPLVHEVLRSPGQPLDAATRAFMEPRFGHDFSTVRVHNDARAAESARAVNALAYTVGQNVVFGLGQYRPQTSVGRGLVAHELTHVLQQRHAIDQGNGVVEIGSPTDTLEYEAERVAGMVAEENEAVATYSSLPDPRITDAPTRSATRLSRATFNVGSVRVEVDYGDVVGIPASEYESAIETRFASWTGSPAVTIHPNLTRLTSSQKRWVLFALDVLIDNTTPVHGGLNRVQAVQRLIGHAPSSSTNPPSTSSLAFEREVLQVSGWFEVALSAPLTAPIGATLTAVRELYNPPPSPSAPPSGALDVIRLQAELVPALTDFLNARDPAKWTSTGTQPIATLQTIADQIQAEARAFFAPYADTAVANAYARGWQYSANLFNVTARSPTRDDRISHLRNRAEVVGRQDRPGGSIFSKVNFDSGRPADRAALLGIVTRMEADPTIRALVNRLDKHTGRTERPSIRVGVSTEFDAAAATECQARWGSLRTLSHELVHALVHPNFLAAETTISFSQIVREGFTEVLGVQLYRHLRARAAASASFKAQMEAGISTPCPAPAETAIGYGAAGSSAEQIRAKVGDDNFRAAYFLGTVRQVGL